MSEMISVVRETNNWMVVNKPSGLGMHSQQSQQGIVAQIKLERGLDYLAPVHRLDTVTSGCLLLAKTPHAAAELSQQFQQRRVSKIYMAITKGKPKKKQGTIKGDMLPARKGSWKLTTSLNDPAITQFFSFGYQQGLRLAIVNILTGKTHQIRVALKSNGCPVYGDLRYADKMNHAQADRCYLHAFQLDFHDEHGQAVSVSCLPEQGELFSTAEFLTALEKSNLEQLRWPK